MSKLHIVCVLFSSKVSLVQFNQFNAGCYIPAWPSVALLVMGRRHNHVLVIMMVSEICVIPKLSFVEFNQFNAGCILIPTVASLVMGRGHKWRDF